MPDSGWYFEDFEVGQVDRTIGRTVTEADLVNFVTFGGIFEEIYHQRRVRAEEDSLFKGRVVPGLLILVVAEGLYVQTGHTHHGRRPSWDSTSYESQPQWCAETRSAQRCPLSLGDTRRGRVRSRHTGTAPQGAQSGLTSK